MPSSNLRELLIEHLVTLLSIPSVTGDEAAITESLVTWATSLPQKPLVRRFGNALVIGEVKGETPTVALVGHTDTVPPAGGVFAPPVIQSDRIIGLGASDMKGALAVMQVLYAQLLDQTEAPSLTPLLVFYDREEGAYADNGLAPLLAATGGLEEADLCLVMEPTDNTLQLGCVGSIQARLTYVGQAAHSARPWQGDNAVHQAGPLLTHLLGRPFHEVFVDGLSFREALSATLISGGKTRNVVPDRCEINLNYRFAPTADAQARALAELKRLADGGTLDVLDVAPAGALPQNNPLLERLIGQSHLKREPKQAWTDVARLAACGRDAVNFGPGLTAQAHQAGEYIEIAAMLDSYEMLWRFFMEPLETTPR